MDALFAELSALRKEGRRREALLRLRPALAGAGPEELERAGRFVLRAVAEGVEAHHTACLLGQCTTSFLRPVLAAVAWKHGLLLALEEGEYDSVLQEVSRPRPRPPAILFLLPWVQRLLGQGGLGLAERAAAELAYWREVWARGAASGARLVQVGWDLPAPSALGHHLSSGPGGERAEVRRASAELRAALPGGYFVDLEEVAGALGRERFYDPRQYHWTKSPFSGAGLVHLAEHLAAGARALTTGPKKVLVLDLDDTLWGGVVGEVGPLGVQLGETPEGEAFRAFQRYVRGLSERGVLLAVASKNNPEDAREPFARNPDMILSLEHFAAFEAGWGAKAEAIERIARSLNLHPDSFVFFDDNPAEREQVRQALPEVAVVEVPRDPAEYVRALASTLYFESALLTEEDRERGRQYAEERRRLEHQEQFASLEAYLASLQMQAEIEDVRAEELPRVAQLVGKTNQFNLTTRRRSEAELGELLAQPGAVGLAVRLADRFGDHGLVAFLLGRAEGEALRIDTWLMSCRVIGRTLEQLCLRVLADRAVALGYRELRGEYLPTKKNALVADLFPRLGFAPLEPGAAGGSRWRLALPAEHPATFVQQRPRG